MELSDKHVSSRSSGGVNNFVRTQLNQYEKWLLSLICLLVILGSASVSMKRPVTFDELFTFLVSTRSSISDLVRALLQGADNHPPLDYLARYLSMSLFGQSSLALRLPSLIAVIGGSLGLYAFVRKKTSPAAALAAIGFILCADTQFYSFVARPYAFLYATAAISLYAWQRVTDNPRDVTGLIVLTTSLACGPLFHYYGIFNYVPIVLGEIVRMARDRRLYLSVAMCVIASLSVMVLLVPFVLNASEFSGNFWTSVNPSAPFRTYFQLISNLGLAVLFCCAGALAARWALGFDSLPWQGEDGLPLHELVAVIVLCLVPFLGYAAALLTGAQTARYSIASIAGLAALMGFFNYFLERRNPMIAVAVLCVMVSGGLLTLAKEVDDASPRRIPERLHAFIAATDAPIVISNPKAFLTLRHDLEVAEREKLYYLTDRARAISHTGSDSDELAMINLSRSIPIRVLDFSEFIGSRERFFVMHRTSGWLLNALLDQGAEVSLRYNFGNLGTALCVNWDDRVESC